MKIVSISGKNVFFVELKQFTGVYAKQIDLSNNTKGIYFLEIETSDGFINKKIIIQ